jgi:hypothetical protein
MKKINSKQQNCKKIRAYICKSHLIHWYLMEERCFNCLLPLGKESAHGLHRECLV